MRIILIAGAALALAACGGDDTSADNMAADNMLFDQNLALDPMMNMDANGVMDSETENMMMNDLNMNDPDTNLANGL